MVLHVRAGRESTACTYTSWATLAMARAAPAVRKHRRSAALHGPVARISCTLWVRRVAEHWNPQNQSHGDRTDAARHAGDLGNVTADDSGRAAFYLVDGAVRVPEVIGRSMVITERADDGGRGGHARSRVDGNAGAGVAWGIIARSAGVFENSKRICTCDGRAVWEEERMRRQQEPQRQVQQAASAAAPTCACAGHTVSR